MIGTHKIEVLEKNKHALQESSLKFAAYERPDFLLMQEALLSYEKIMQHQGRHVDSTVAEKDKEFIFNHLKVVI